MNFFPQLILQKIGNFLYWRSSVQIHNHLLDLKTGKDEYSNAEIQVMKSMHTLFIGQTCDLHSVFSWKSKNLFYMVSWSTEDNRKARGRKRLEEISEITQNMSLQHDSQGPWLQTNSSAHPNSQWVMTSAMAQKQMHTH